MEYNFRDIEQRWRENWARCGTYRAEEREDKEKFYVLNMFPYPSGAGLHVGHPLGYIASDIYARYKRLRGYNVLNPMGYDAYGLPAEQYAIQTGQHPAITTQENIARYREQLDKIGFCFDWEREVRTCEPNYYHWTQWAFQRMFESFYCNARQKAAPIAELEAHLAAHGTEGLDVAQSAELSFTAQEWAAMSAVEQQEVLMNYRLAYLGETMVNWCPALGTVLANDEVVDGVSERGGHPVVQKKMKQWCLRVSAYAQRLLDGLDTIDWTDSLKETQRNWIGRSEGTEMEFAVKDSDVHFTIFTTRADTIFGVTFMVLAPESQLVQQLTTESQRAEVEAYVEATKKRTERERIADRKVSGVFSGSYAINPFTGEEIPIWVSDYVLAGYGTGAIMAVPAHDSRDYAFARHFDLPIIPLIEGADVSEQSFDAKEGVVMNSPKSCPLPTSPLGGGVPCGGTHYMTASPDRYALLKEYAKTHRRTPTPAEKVMWEVLRGSSMGVKFRRQHAIGDYIADFVCLSHQLVVEIDGGYHEITEQQELDAIRTEYLNNVGFEVLRFTNEEVLGNTDAVIDTIAQHLSHSAGHSSPLGGGGEGATFSLNGLSIHEAIAATKRFVEEHQLGRIKVNFRLRDAIFSRQRYWGEPFPVYYKEGMPQMIPAECLPLELPEVKKFLPTESGEPPLGNAERWAWDTQRNCVVSNSEIDHKNVFPLELSTMPGFAGSSAYFLRYMDPKNTEALVGEKAVNYWQNVDLYLGGSEHATGHLIYSRFWNKVLFDLGVALKDEPFQKLVNQGMIQGRSNFVYRIKDSNTFVSLGLKDQYEVTPLHVDVNIVQNDVLDTEAFRQWRPEYADAEFILEDGQYICGWAVEKMSKSMFNVVNPDMIVEKYGADTLRLYEMFLGPINQSKPWDSNGIDGCFRFLKKVWNLFYKGDALAVTDEAPTKDNLKTLHKLIKKVTEDIEEFSYNTSIPAFMIAVGELAQQKCSSRQVLETYLILLAPFAPHIAEELWHALGHTTTICDAQWPEHNEDYLKADSYTLGISFNGKTRFTLDFPADATAEEMEKTALAAEQSQKYLEGMTVAKVIVVPGRIVNIVLKK